MRHGGGRLVAVDGDAHHLRAGAGERGDLRDGRRDVGRVGVGHRLDDDRRAAADRHGRPPASRPHLDRAVACAGAPAISASCGERRSALMSSSNVGRQAAALQCGAGSGHFDDRGRAAKSPPPRRRRRGCGASSPSVRSCTEPQASQIRKATGSASPWPWPHAMKALRRREPMHQPMLDQEIQRPVDRDRRRAFACLAAIRSIIS